MRKKKDKTNGQLTVDKNKNDETNRQKKMTKGIRQKKIIVPVVCEWLGGFKRIFHSAKILKMTKSQHVAIALIENNIVSFKRRINEATPSAKRSFRHDIHKGKTKLYAIRTLALP